MAPPKCGRCCRRSPPRRSQRDDYRARNTRGRRNSLSSCLNLPGAKPAHGRHHP
jgi:hypothetical protein